MVKRLLRGSQERGKCSSCCHSGAGAWLAAWLICSTTGRGKDPRSPLLQSLLDATSAEFAADTISGSNVMMMKQSFMSSDVG